MPTIKTLSDAQALRVDQLRVWLRARARPETGTKTDLLEQVAIELLRKKTPLHRPGASSHAARGLRGLRDLRMERTAPHPPPPPTKAQRVYDTASQSQEWTAYAPTLAAREKVLVNASEGVAEYVRFMSLKASMDDWNATFLSPSFAIDSVWHNHILDTRVYDEHCRKLFGRMVEHNPDGPEEDDQPQRYQRTLALYRAMYGKEPPKEWWPLKEPGPPVAKVTLKTLMGATTDIRVTPDMLVRDVLKLFYNDDDDAQECSPLRRTRLIYAGRPMAHDETLAEYEVSHNATLHVVLPLRGC